MPPERACRHQRLWGVEDEPRPLAVQVWDNDPETLAAVGRQLVVEYRPSVIDLNFGCPVPAVAKKAHSGSYLLRDPELVGQIVSRVAAACRPVPVTAKIRTGCTRDTINAIDVAQAIEGAGGAAVTVHGRTAEDLFRGSADWDQIARIKPHLGRIPLVGNGDLTTAAAVAAAFDRYGVDGVMIGRAGLARPWLFRQAAAALRGEPDAAGPDADRTAGIAARSLSAGGRSFRRGERDGADAALCLSIRPRPPRRPRLPPRGGPRGDARSSSSPSSSELFPECVASRPGYIGLSSPGRQIIIHQIHRVGCIATTR